MCLRCEYFFALSNQFDKGASEFVRRLQFVIPAVVSGDPATFCPLKIKATGSPIESFGDDIK